MSTIVVVEGESDRVAFETLARCVGRDLAAEDVRVEAIGGAHAVGPYLRGLPRGDWPHLAGLVDAPEAPRFARALERAGIGAGLDVRDLDRIGFFICFEDLEDELIRALGGPGVEMVVAQQGELRSFRSFQKQPAHREESLEAQLHRFLGTHAGRKAMYARALVEAGVPDRVPPPLTSLLQYVAPR